MNLLQAAQRTTQTLLNARGVRSRTVSIGGERLHHYALEGSGHGAPVLLVHGLGGSANGFASLFFGLARRFRRVHAVDLPGHGLSPESSAPTPTLRNQVELLKGFCTQVLSEPALVVGNSLGGALSMQLASETPEHVRALGLLAPAGARVDPARQQELLRILKVSGPEDARRVTARLFHRLPLAMRLLAGQMQSFYGTATVHALIEDAAREGGLAPELLGGLRPPVLLCWGESERLLPFEGLDYFRAHLPSHAQIEVLPRSGHVPQVEVPQLVIARLCRFADQLGI